MKNATAAAPLKPLGQRSQAAEVDGFLQLEDGPLPKGFVPPAWTGGLINEWRCRARLEAIDAYPTQSLLLQGPPGVGKTTAARFIAEALQVPCYTLLLAGGISAFLGETAKNLSGAIRWAGANPCVLVLDEVDAVTWQRGTDTGSVGGEMRRVVSSLIQSLDWWHRAPRCSMMVGTTNLADSIDEAIRGRFEAEFAIDLPTVAELAAVAGIEIPDHVEMSFRELQRLILQAKRAAAVAGRPEEHAKVLADLIAADFPRE